MFVDVAPVVDDNIETAVFFAEANQTVLIWLVTLPDVNAVFTEITFIVKINPDNLALTKIGFISACRIAPASGDS